MLAELRHIWAERGFNQARLEKFHSSVRVGGRYLALPLEEYRGLSGFGAANDVWIRVGQEVGEAAISEALTRAGRQADEINAIFLSSVTGVATPSLDARLANRMGFAPDIKRVPMFGLGCVAGAAGISRAADYVRAYPQEVALVVSVELCSLTLQREDISVANLISSGLFGDGAAAVVVVGDSQPADGPEILATRSIFYPDSEGVMGWNISEKGFRVVLSAGVPQVVEEHLREDVDGFLAEHDLDRSAISSWIAHPGGPRVLEAMHEALELTNGALDLTWKSLHEVGNLSSTSVLLVLRETMEHQRPEPGSLGLLFAMGPGFCSELVLLRW